MTEMGITQVLREQGPLTGSELVEIVDLEPLDLWRSCVTNSDILVRRLGRRFLRLDRAVTGYARLSPSIRREFLTYTLLDMVGREERLELRAAEMTEEIGRISLAKRRLVAQTMKTVVDSLEASSLICDRACFILAGDITYNMAHRVPRPERSTGKLVLGSDLDIVVVTEDDIDPEVRQALDDAIYEKKRFLLISPSYREEIDYLIKDMTAVRGQTAFDTFEHMVACKILAEGEFVYGSEGLFASIKRLLSEKEIPGRLASMEEDAVRYRAQAERTLSEVGAQKSATRFLNLFYTSDEGDEIY